jgi:UDP-GlcNAc3NAcA epimerase
MIIRILTIIGTRPQFIKSATLSRTFQKAHDIEEILVHTGQHFDFNMSGIFFKELQIQKPKYILNINEGSHGQMTGRMLEAIENVIMAEKPNATLIYGDTNSTLAGALAASKLHIPVIHVEAGLRSYNKKMPEEINRILADHLSYLCFCPTKVSVENLKKEGITQGVYHVGDIMYDATLYAIEHIKNNKAAEQNLSFLPKKFAFMTVHRAESTQSQDTFHKIINFAQKFSYDNDLKIIFPVHPRTRKLIDKNFMQLNENIILTDPLSYFETHYCLSKTKYVLTDSGGLQKEAYFHRVPCVTLRTETEWIETIEHGWNRLWTDNVHKPRCDIADYGDGHCAEKVTEIIREYFS